MANQMYDSRIFNTPSQTVTPLGDLGITVFMLGRQNPGNLVGATHEFIAASASCLCDEQPWQCVRTTEAHHIDPQGR